MKVRNDAPIELLGPLGCGVQTGAGSIMSSLGCEAGSSLLILGGGSVGLSAVLAAVVQGCQDIIVSDPIAARRKLAVELGATHTIDPMGTDDFVAEVRSIVPRGVNYILDTTGKAKVMSEAMAALDHRGVLGVVAIPATPNDMVLPIDVLGVLGHGLQIKGISEGDIDPQTFIPSLIDLYLNGEFPFDKLIASYPLDEINQAVEDQLNGLCVKPVLAP
ncbi:MAG: zinc-binding dehydrogenase [Gammaproteobacteria bacterium]|nr:zinc-binding dehydrogenase [Gammaproteobacteria bacterium]